MAIGATYIDQRYVYPALFGSDNPQNPTGLLGLDQMTGEDGAPSHRIWGRNALVGGHCMFFENLETVTQRTSTKKTGAGAQFTRRTALVGIGWAHSRAQAVEVIIADQKTFWLESHDNVYWSDYRVDITTGTSPTRLIIAPTSYSTQDIGPVIFVVGDIVRVNGVTPAGNNGLWRVHASYGLGDAAHPLGYLELTPLQGQTPASGSAGSPAAPMEITRMESVLADAGHPLLAGYPRGVSIDNGTGSTTLVTVRVVTIENRPDSYQTSHYHRAPADIFTVGSTVQLTGWSTLTGEPIDGIAQIKIVRPNQRSANTADTVTRYTDLVCELGGQRTMSGALFDTRGITTSATNPPRVEFYGQAGFVEPSDGQVHKFYTGNETDGPDEDLQAIYG